MTSGASREAVDCSPTLPVDVNTRVRSSYRGRRCPRWRLRDGEDLASSEGSIRKTKTKTKKKTLIASSDGGKPFEKVAETKDGITVFSRVSSDKTCQIKELLAETTFLDISVRQFWRAVADVENYHDFVPFVKKSLVLKRELGVTGTIGSGTADTDNKVNIVWAYNEVKPPIASARDFCIEIISPASIDFDTIVTKQTQFTSRWEIDLIEAPEVKKGIVRITQNKGSWTISPLNNSSNGVKVTYSLLTDPGASLPPMLIDAANKKTVPDVLRAFAKRAGSGVYDVEDDDDVDEKIIPALTWALRRIRDAMDEFLAVK